MSSAAQAQVVTVANVAREEIDWLWKNRIAVRKATLLVGDPGVNKSTLTCDIASHVTTGKSWPDGTSCKKGEVLMLSAEDEVSDTIRPRLEAANADLSKVHVLTFVTEQRNGSEVERSFSMSDDVTLLEFELEKRPGIRLVTIDPVSAYLGLIDSHNNAEVRGALTPLARLAEKHGVALVCVTHLNKSLAQSAMYRATGSLAFVAASRSVYLIAKDQNNPTRRLFLPLKNNIAPDGAGLAFSVVQSDEGAPYLAWERQPIIVSAEEALGGNTEHHNERDEAKQWLRAELANGPVQMKALKYRAEEQGHAWRTVQRAKADIGVKSQKEGFGGEWRWNLPKNATEPKERHSH